MDAEMLKEAITLAGGPEFIAGLYYDNSGRTLFIEEPFQMSMIQGNFIVVEEEDIFGIKTKTYKPIETVQTILTVTNADDRRKIDIHYNRN